MTISQPPHEQAAKLTGLFFDPQIAGKLQGCTLQSGWLVKERCRKPEAGNPYDQTGSNFSIGYIAEKDGVKGYLKVFDLAGEMARNPDNPLAALINATRDRQFECSILEACNSAGLSRIVRVLHHAEETIQTPSGYPMPINYIIFELADADIRKAVKKSEMITDIWRMQILHNAAVGLQQLHSLKIAHQDIKPSNILTFKEEGAKLADLGRALQQGIGAIHDALPFAGAREYASPEQAYGVLPESWIDRRESSDLYQLGAILAFIFTGTTPSQFYCSMLPSNIRPSAWGGSWGGSYEEALPHLTAKFAEYLDSVKISFPKWAANDLCNILQQLCTPDYKRRGHPDTNQWKHRTLGLERYISKFDQLRLKAQIEARKLS